MFNHKINVAKLTGNRVDGARVTPIYNHLFRVELPHNEHNGDSAITVFLELKAKFPAPEFSVSLSRSPVQGWTDISEYAVNHPKLAGI